MSYLRLLCLFVGGLMSYLRLLCLFVGGLMSYLRLLCFLLGCLFVGGLMSYLRLLCLFVGGRMSYLRYLCLFVERLMSNLRYLCLFAYSGVQHILCCIFALFFFALLSIPLDCPSLISPSIFSNVYLSVLHESYFRKASSCARNLTSTFLFLVCIDTRTTVLLVNQYILLYL
jgi:hypothetical protein